ncbi:MAG: methyltransferase domain-containing protein [Pseudomonadales bacterium]|nr:methyltransferase domain-containing protein [Pseudomonadales bacterium]
MRLNWLCDLRATADTPFWRSELAGRVQQIEGLLGADLIARLHGESVVWMGATPNPASVLEKRMIKCPIFVTSHGQSGSLPTVVSEFDNLPFQSRSVDAVVMHHALEEVSDPRTVLREATRILAPGGRLIVFGFNPWSLLGLRRGVASIIPDRLAQLRLVNPIRLFDWFTLLGLELDAPPAYGGFALLWDRFSVKSVVPSASQIPFGGLVITSAVKQQATMHFKRQATQPRPKLAPVAYPRVSTWRRHKFRPPLDD